MVTGGAGVIPSPGGGTLSDRLDARKNVKICSDPCEVISEWEEKRRMGREDR